MNTWSKFGMALVACSVIAVGCSKKEEPAPAAATAVPPSVQAALDDASKKAQDASVKAQKAVQEATATASAEGAKAAQAASAAAAQAAQQAAVASQQAAQAITNGMPPPQVPPMSK